MTLPLLPPIWPSNRSAFNTLTPDFRHFPHVTKYCSSYQRRKELKTISMKTRASLSDTFKIPDLTILEEKRQDEDIPSRGLRA